MDDLKRRIREHYGAAAASVAAQQGEACCAGQPTCCPQSSRQPDDPADGDALGVSEDLYDEAQAGDVPLPALQASLGCGNPVALAELRPGEVVLDLGSGGGIDVLLSARRVGPTGKAYGLDMTDEMLALARRNQHEAGVGNAEFLKGDIEAVPLPDASVDVIISNCVVNLAPDKDKVLAEAFRVLRPGGRFAVADMVFLGDAGAISPQVREHAEAWASCISGALSDGDYLDRLRATGFRNARVEVLRTHDPAQLMGDCCGSQPASAPTCCCGTGDQTAAPFALPPGVQLASAFIRARKPDS